MNSSLIVGISIPSIRPKLIPSRTLESKCIVSSEVIVRAFRRMPIARDTLSCSQVGWDKPLWAQAHHRLPDSVERGGLRLLDAAVKVLT